jgi:hypothetical protein
MNRVKKNIGTPIGETLLRTSIESKPDNEPNNDDDERGKNEIIVLQQSPELQVLRFYISLMLIVTVGVERKNMFSFAYRG